ncbi:TylF/MycF family methyltransferase [Cyanobium sp. FGCU-6]|nr:TylF/MycF family methyltransferase [Cyanobium sp. FGCU6]
MDLIHADEIAYHSEIQDDEFRETFLRCCPYSMVHVTGFYNVYQSLKYIRDGGLPGDIVECGCALGGVAIFMRLLVKRWGLNKTIHLFDTFVGPPVGSADIIHGGGELVWTQAMANHRSGTEQNIIDITGNLEGINIVEGFVEQTLPVASIPELSLLRLDTDFYESTKIELEVLYPKLVRGGVIIIDDYGYFQGSRRATDEYLATIYPKPLLNRIDTAVWAGVKP